MRREEGDGDLYKFLLYVEYQVSGGKPLRMAIGH